MNSPSTQLPPETGQPAPPEGGAHVKALEEALRSSFWVVRLIMFALVVLFFAKGIFSVSGENVAIILRFGKPLGTGSGRILKPGLHWSFPYPMDEVVAIPVNQSQTVVSRGGWYAITPEQRAAGREPQARSSLAPGADGYELTGDGGVIHAKATLKYRISDPVRYAFEYNELSHTLQNLLDNALIKTSAHFSADDAIYKNKIHFKEAVFAELQKSIDRLSLGITLEPSDIETTPPLYVRPAFDAVLAAEQDRGRVMSDARGYADETSRKAAGEAEAKISEAQGDSLRFTQVVAADADYFNSQLSFYQQDPGLFRRRMLSDVLARIYSAAQDKFYIPERPDSRPRELRLLLNREPQKAGGKPSETPR